MNGTIQHIYWRNNTELKSKTNSHDKECAHIQAQAALVRANIHQEEQAQHRQPGLNTGQAEPLAYGRRAEMRICIARHGKKPWI